MDKKDAVLVILSREALSAALEKLSNVNVVTIVADGDEKFFKVGKKKIPRTAFAAIPDVAAEYKDFIWLISGCVKGRDDILRAKKLLMIFDVPEENIVNMEVAARVSETWLANLNYIEENGADFFATGNEYMQIGLNLKSIPRVHADKKSRGGVNLADAFQDLRQSYLTARYVFAHTIPGTIKFVLIGLSPYSLRYDNAKDFANQNNLQYLFKLKAATADAYDNLIGITPFDFMYLCRFKSPKVEAETPESAYDSLLKNLFGDYVKDMFATTAKADVNFGAIKAKFDHEFSDEAIPDWDDEEKFINTGDVEKNVQILEDYIKLCLDNDAKPIVVILPCSPVKRKIYSKNFLKNFYDTIHKIEESYDFSCVDLFDRLTNPNSFCDANHLNNRGILIFNSLLSFHLNKEDLIPLRNFCDMNYGYFNQLSWIIPKDEYHTFMNRLYKASAQMIACKKKIKIAFVARTASEWCGNELYNLFARDERFETTVFLCLRLNQVVSYEEAEKELLQGVEQLKAHGLNVVAVDDWREKIPLQDVIIFLTPYFIDLSKEPVIKILTPKTLMTYVPYALDVVKYSGLYKEVIFTLGWKLFFYSAMSIEEYDENCRLGMPRGFYSGHPKTDNFFNEDSNLSFYWKIARSGKKKIIWAPHWSMNYGIFNSTFHWNYQFMYDFAKAHPELSWIVKPHPLLAFEAVKEGLFPSEEAYEEYLQKWNDLPNAQVYTGAYYQAIFATSDGMILDSSSFLAEYQYVDKPVIYLTRDTQKFYKLGEKILEGSYTVDGKDLDGLAATIQQVFIEGDDYKADERREIFDKYLNYPKVNGMLASEFVYKSIADELKRFQF